MINYYLCVKSRSESILEAFMDGLIKKSPYHKPKIQSFKNQNIKYDLLLQFCFSFNYAGKCVVFIQTRRNKFELVHEGVHLVDDIFVFAPNYHARFEFDTLYQAILAFNKTVQILTSSMDWYNPELYSPGNIYNEVFYKD